MATEEQRYENVKVLHLSKSEKMQMIARLAAQISEEDILFSDGSCAIPSTSILQIRVSDGHGNRLYCLTIE